MVGDMDITKQSSNPLPVVTHCGADVILDGSIEHPGTSPMTVENEERVGCVTAL
jgi:hypothetical protein